MLYGVAVKPARVPQKRFANLAEGFYNQIIVGGGKSAYCGKPHSAQLLRGCFAYIQ